MEQFETESMMLFNMQEIGARIAYLRREQDLTQAELAEHLGISYQAVSSWERGASMPDISKLVDLARALHTTVDALLGSEPKEKSEVTELAPEVAEHAAWAVEHAEDAPKDKKRLDMKLVTQLALFLPSGELEKLVLEARDEVNYDALRRLAPFVRQETLVKLLNRLRGE